MHVLDLMNEYFEGHAKNVDMLNEAVDTGFVEWQKIDSPERLIRDYNFSSREMALEFLRQLFLYEDGVGHHAKITVEYDKVRVEVYTHDISRVTERDIEYATAADQIYMDASFICQNI